MDVIELIEEYKDAQKYCLYTQEEISAQVVDEKFIPSNYVYHGLRLALGYTIGRTISKEDSFYDSFRQGLRKHAICVTVNELKEICRSFALNPPDWFKDGINQNIIKSKNTVKIFWNQFAKTVQFENKWNDPEIQGWILCNKYEVRLYLIEKQIGSEVYTTKIIDKNSCTTLNSELFFCKEKELTIVNLGCGRYEPVINNLTQIMDGDFGNLKIENKKVIYTAESKVKKPTSGLSEDQNSETYNLVIDAMNGLDNIVKDGNIDKFKQQIEFLYGVDRNFLIEVFKDPRNSLKNSSIIILPCKYNRLHILRYIIHESSILYNFPPVDSSKSYDDKEKSIYYATKTANIDLLETLYDHFLDELHWSCNHQNKDILEKLKEINVILIKTWTNNIEILNKDLQFMVDVHCLIEISNFQIELYTKLAKLKYDISDADDIRKAETETVVKVMLTILRVFQKYRLKDIRLPSDVPGVEVRIQKLFADKTSIYMKNIHQCMYEVYYRKLDSYASLLILDNLHYLQQRLELGSNEYISLESAIYYFIYRVYEDWRLFLPNNREKTKIEYLVDTYNIKRKNKVSATYDKSKMFLGPVLCLSRKDFFDALMRFLNVLENIEIKDKIRKKNKKLPIVELNKLTFLPLMRDSFSLRKILVYLESLSKVNLDNDKDVGILMIERAIQVIGELFKTTNESVHLDALTKALLELEIPSEVIENLKSIRNLLSHSDKARLLRRIHIETKEPKYFKEVLKDLNEIKERIYEVINLYDIIIDKWIIDKGLSIIESRKNELPVENLHILRMQLIAIPSDYPDYLIQYEKTLIEKHKISRQLVREINSLFNNEIELANIRDCVKNYSLNVVITKLNHFSRTIRDKLGYIQKNSSDECVKEWELIIQLFEYIVTVAGFLDDHHYEIKHSAYSRMIRKMKNRVSHFDGIIEAQLLLAVIETHAKKYDGGINASLPNDSNTIVINRSHDFKGITSLKVDLDNHFRFIIDEELRYVLDDFSKSYGDSADKVYKEHEKVFKNLTDNVPITGTDRKKICALNIDDNSKRIIRCLDMGANRDSKLRYCFENRINLLKHLVQGPNEDVKSLALKYKHNEKFRLAIEMILVDIMNVLKHIKETEALTKQNKMYTDANIRNILEHSEPLLEVIGNALDPNDFATALAEKALKFVQKADDWITALELLKK